MPFVVSITTRMWSGQPAQCVFEFHHGKSQKEDMENLRSGPNIQGTKKNSRNSLPTVIGDVLSTAEQLCLTHMKNRPKFDQRNAAHILTQSAHQKGDISHYQSMGPWEAHTIHNRSNRYIHLSCSCDFPYTMQSAPLMATLPWNVLWALPSCRSTSDSKSDIRRMLIRTCRIYLDMSMRSWHAMTCVSNDVKGHECIVPWREANTLGLFAHARSALNGCHTAQPGFRMLPSCTVLHPEQRADQLRKRKSKPTSQRWH